MPASVEILPLNRRNAFEFISNCLLLNTLKKLVLFFDQE
jgi:hypothetical protein